MRLEHIEISHLALFDQAILEPDHHFTVLTGETGAGKSLLISAVEAISGAKVNKEQIRSGFNTARVQALFSSATGDEIRQFGLVEEEESVGLESSDLILDRQLSLQGKSVCKVNGTLFTQTKLRELGEMLISIHGQRESQKIFNPKEHAPLLLKYHCLGDQSSLQTYRKALSDYRHTRQQLQKLGMDEHEREQKIDLLTYQINEIRTFQPTIGEEEKLAQRSLRLQQTQKLAASLAGILTNLQGQEEAYAPLASLRSALHNLEQLSSQIGKLQADVEQFQQGLDRIENVAVKLENIYENLAFSPEELEEIESRLDKLSRLKKKYGGSLESVLAYLSKAEQTRDFLVTAEKNIQQLTLRLQGQEADLVTLGQKFQEDYQASAERLAEEINRELSDLGMKQARFSVSFTHLPLEQANEGGLYRPEFMIETNPGEGFKALAQTASGGEAARIMLAIKSILAKVDQVPVLIFDEVDSGVSGETAARVGEKLLLLSRFAQVICVTHSAYIASMADTHYEIAKHVSEGRTFTELKKLDRSEACHEIARLLAGNTNRKTALELAASLQDHADAFKSEHRL